MATYLGTVGDDTLIGGSDNDILQGEAGNDYLLGGAGDDSIDGGTGFDFAAYTDATGAVTVNLALGTASGAGVGTDTLTRIEQVDGSSFDDILTGGNAASDGYEGFRGLAGNDTIDGGSGFDRARYDNSPASVSVTLGGTGSGTASDGWGGTDTLINIESVRGSAFNDTLTGSDSSAIEEFEGRAGDDLIDGRGGEDQVRYVTSPAAVTVNLATGVAQDGWGGTDTLLNIERVRGSEFNDTLTGNASNNTIEGRGGNDILQGEAGDDYLLGGAGDDSIDGGTGDDFAAYTDATGAVTVNLALGTASGAGVGTDTLISIEQVDGSSFDDILTGGNVASDGYEGFRGLAGNDTIDGGSGFDRARYDNSPASVSVTLGGTGNGTASDGWGGTDTLINIESVRGSAFNDTLTGSDSSAIEEFEGRAGDDLIDGRGGEDRVRYVTSPNAVVVNLTTGVAQDGWGGTDTLLNIERILGSDFNDTLTGNFGGNTIEGRGGNDILQGEAGDDYLLGGAGDDSIDGGTGFDFAAYTDATGAVTVNLALGTASGAGVGTDTLTRIEQVEGSAFDDILTGGNAASDDFEGFRGLAGNDTIDGGSGFDRAYYNNSPASVSVTLGGTSNGTASDGWGGTDTLNRGRDTHYWAPPAQIRTCPI